jgi:hypothetical protein
MTSDDFADASLSVFASASSSRLPPKTERRTREASSSSPPSAGAVYGAADGLLLSAFPILRVFAALRDTRLRRRTGGVVAVGAIAIAASLAMTAVYHAGYSDFRSDKMRKPVTGDLVWSVPTLATLNPIGAPVAHVSLHVGAVVHNHDTDLFLPPH